jgi:hypothetical protein
MSLLDACAAMVQLVHLSLVQAVAGLKGQAPPFQPFLWGAPLPQFLEHTMSEKQDYPLPHAIFFIAVTCAIGAGLVLLIAI